MGKELKEEKLEKVDGGLLKKAYTVNSTGDDTKTKCLMCGYEFEESEMFKPRTCQECGGHYLSNMENGKKAFLTEPGLIKEEIYVR